MITCPNCQHNNEEGVLFCEECKADLEGREPVAEPMGETTIPVAELVEADDSVKLQPLDDAPPEEEGAPGTIEVGAAAAPTSVGDEPPMPVPLAEGAAPKLIVLRGLRVNAEYPVYSGKNFIGRTDDKPVDIDLEDQESADRIWSSRQHACITFDNNTLSIEDLNSSNGTFVNRTRVHPGESRPLQVNDVIQIGTVQLKLEA